MLGPRYCGGQMWSVGVSGLWCCAVPGWWPHQESNRSNPRKLILQDENRRSLSVAIQSVFLRPLWDSLCLPDRAHQISDRSIALYCIVTIVSYWSLQVPETNVRDQENGRHHCAASNEARSGWVIDRDALFRLNDKHVLAFFSLSYWMMMSVRFTGPPTDCKEWM